jgi:hypothetical protein
VVATQLTLPMAQAVVQHLRARRDVHAMDTEHFCMQGHPKDAGLFTKYTTADRARTARVGNLTSTTWALGALGGIRTPNLLIRSQML